MSSLTKREVCRKRYQTEVSNQGTDRARRAKFVQKMQVLYIFLMTEQLPLQTHLTIGKLGEFLSNSTRIRAIFAEISNKSDNLYSSVG